jgi:hypothetical protein
MKSSGRPSRLVLAAALFLAAGAPSVGAAELPCGALGAADIAGLGFGQSREGAPSGWRKNVSLESQAAIFGREADCLWATPTGTVELTVGDFDTNVVKGEQVRTLARKVLASVQEKLRLQAQYGGSKIAITPLAGVGEEAFVARLHQTAFQVVAFQGPRVVRLLVDASPGVPRKPTPEGVGALVRQALVAQTGYTSAGAPPADPREAAAPPVSRTLVRGSIVASGTLAGTFTWNEPNAVEAYPARFEVTLNTADKASWMNLQVFRDGRVELRSGKLGAGKLSGTGGRADYDALAARGSVSVDGTVSAGAERVTLRGRLSFEPPAR